MSFKKEPIVLQHNTHEIGSFSINNKGRFGGIFASPGGGMYAPNKHAVAIDPDKLLTHQMLDYEIPYEDVMTATRKALPGYSDDEIERLWPYIMEEGRSSVHDLAPSDLEKIFRTDDYADASWEAQKIRGDVARNLGYYAVEMKDEEGISTLVMKGITYPAREGESYDDIVSGIYEKWNKNRKN